MNLSVISLNRDYSLTRVYFVILRLSYNLRFHNISTNFFVFDALVHALSLRLPSQMSWVFGYIIKPSMPVYSAFFAATVFKCIQLSLHFTGLKFMPEER